MASPGSVAVIIGTRPEAIKLAPVVLELRARDLPVTTILTGQHRELARDVLDLFRIDCDLDLDVMTRAQSLHQTMAVLLTRLTDAFESLAPRLVLTQGDTTSTLAGSLAAYYRGIPVGHVEAGLRTRDKRNPFPEEMNRRLTSCLADLHFAPTERAHRALTREGIDPGQITITGNTVIDALLWARAHTAPGLEVAALRPTSASRLIVVTAHRRENWGQPLRDICAAVLELVDRFPEVVVAWPVHPNPAVADTVTPLLADRERVHLLAPLPYHDFVHLMDASYLILSDSGGIQEEAPSLGKPVLVARDKTERPEAIDAGTVRLVGTERAAIVTAATALLSSTEEYARMARQTNPFGDGLAARRIVDVIAASTPRDAPKAP